MGGSSFADTLPSCRPDWGSISFLIGLPNRHADQQVAQIRHLLVVSDPTGRDGRAASEQAGHAGRLSRLCLEVSRRAFEVQRWTCKDTTRFVARPHVGRRLNSECGVKGNQSDKAGRVQGWDWMTLWTMFAAHQQCVRLPWCSPIVSHWRLKVLGKQTHNTSDLPHT